MVNADAANARLLTQLIPKSDELDPALPSIAEALAVLSGCTLLNSGIDSPFDDEPVGNALTEPPNILEDPVLRDFQALLRVSDYGSGATMPWQNVFS